ncbi:MAG: endolytic transglycosylase MltG, partial [Clostridia bacterium]
TLFTMFYKLTSSDSKIISGKFEPNSNLDYRALSRMLTRKSNYRETVRITIPEGYELKQIEKILVEKGVCDEKKLTDTLANHDFEYDFLKGIKKGDAKRLEGYLFPDTYEFYTNDDPANVIDKMLANFASKYTAAMRARAKELGMTTSEIITLASIIEREATSTDKELVSSVFHNRLRSGRYQYLQSCATVQYALGERKARLSIEDTKVTSPYNTYQNKGLPPGPIASPGNESIEAALYPAESDYMFFALLKDGTHKFSKTYDEHMKSENVNPN